MNSKREKTHFKSFWLTFLEMIEYLAFNKLNFKKIFVYSFEVRPHLYEILNEANYIQETRLKSQKLINGDFFDALVHSKFNS